MSSGHAEKLLEGDRPSRSRGKEASATSARDGTMERKNRQISAIYRQQSAFSHPRCSAHRTKALGGRRPRRCGQPLSLNPKISLGPHGGGMGTGRICGQASVSPICRTASRQTEIGRLRCAKVLDGMDVPENQPESHSVAPSEPVVRRSGAAARKSNREAFRVAGPPPTPNRLRLSSERVDSRTTPLQDAQSIA